MEITMIYILFILSYFLKDMLLVFLISKIMSLKVGWASVGLMSFSIAVYVGISAFTVSMSPVITYSMLIILYAVLVFSAFEGSIVLKLSCVFIAMTNLMAATIIVGAVVALVSNYTIYDIVNTHLLLTGIRWIIVGLSCVEMIVILRMIKPKFLKALGKYTYRLNILYMIVSFLLLAVIINSIFFTAKIDLTVFFVQQLGFGICIMGILYAMLFMMIGYEILEDKRLKITTNLEKQYKSMVVNNAMMSLEINCSTATVISYSNKGELQIELAGIPYGNFMAFFATNHIYKDDRKSVGMATSIPYMMDMYKKGIHEYKYEYRLLENGEYNWHRAYTSLADCKGEIIAITTIENIQPYKNLTLTAEVEPVTELYNKESTQMLVSSLLQNYSEGIMFMIDLDNFKTVNDNLGHSVGDRALKDVAAKLTQSFEDADVIGRIGGDEFIVYFKTANINISERAQDICEKITQTYSKDNVNITISASIGIAIANEKMMDFQEICHYADVALYQSKKLGKNTFTVYKHKLSEAAVESKFFFEEI